MIERRVNTMKINNEISWTHNENGIVLINSRKGKSIVLNETGKLVWELLSQGMSVEAICDHCVRMYKMTDSSLIRDDVISLIELLREHEMIEVDRNE
jgi:hypothetical protein